MTPPTSMIGAITMIVSVIMTNIWTCWTSFVVRVMSEGAPNVRSSCSLKRWTRSKRAPRRSRPTAMAVRAPK